jgi:hypothetical protein
LTASLSRSRSRAKPKYRYLEQKSIPPYPTMSSYSSLRKNKRGWF